jgi:hypothetical protein
MQIVQVNDTDREKTATRHFLSHPLFRRDLLCALGMDGLTWVIIEAQKPRLIPGQFGDVDILAGNITFKNPQEFARALRDAENQWPGMSEPALQEYACKVVAEADGLNWPPISSRIVGVEVKCGYLDREKGPQSTKSSPKKVDGTRGQIDRLIEMGLDMVALLDIIGNNPTEAYGAFLEAGRRAQDSARAFQPILEGRLPANTPAAQFCWSVGSVFDRDERFSGGGGLLRLRQGLPNLTAGATEDAVLNRKTLLKNVSDFLGILPTPRFCPVFFIDCPDCAWLHFLDDSACAWKPKPKVSQT